MTEPRIDGARLLSRLDAFASIGATAKGGVDRQALTKGDRDARGLLASLATSRGFAVQQDAAANLFVIRPGRDASIPPLLIGSHLDTQPTGGRFDGALGVLAAFEVLEALEDSRTETERTVEVVAWTNEEGCRFAPGVMGSQAFAAGSLSPNWVGLRGTDGASFEDELWATLAALPNAAMRPLGGTVAAYLELHIEQGPVLEREDVPIGVVTGIQGTRWLEVAISGASAHAGTTPLAYRRDPMSAAASAIHALQDVMSSDDAARLTVGRIRAEPGSINAVPEHVVFSVDLRHPDARSLSAMEASVRTAVANCADAAGCEAAVAVVFDMPPVAFPAAMIELIENGTVRASLSSRRLISGAFHDALFVARRAQAGMIFVPCRDGLSHNEAEYVEPRFVVAGAEVLLASVLGFETMSAGIGRRV